MSLQKLLYCSRNFIAGTPAECDREIAQILQAARANNHKQDVTGALLFSSGYFAQVLEGPGPAVEKIFEKIQRDPRHGDVTVLESETAETRDFPDWSMAHVIPASEGQSAGISAALDHALGDPTVSSTKVWDLMRTLVVQED